MPVIFVANDCDATRRIRRRVRRRSALADFLPQNIPALPALDKARHAALFVALNDVADTKIAGREEDVRGVRTPYHRVPAVARRNQLAAGNRNRLARLRAFEPIDARILRELICGQHDRRRIGPLGKNLLGDFLPAIRSPSPGREREIIGMQRL